MDTSDPPSARALCGPRGVWALSAVMAAAAVAIVTRLDVPAGRAEVLHLPWWLLVAGFLAAELFVVHLPFGRNSYAFSLSEIPLSLALVSLAPGAAVATRLLGSGGGFLAQRLRGVKLAFNITGVALETAVGAGVYWSVLGDGDVLGPRGWAALLAAALAVDLLSACTITAAISLMEGRIEHATFREVLLTGGVAATTNTSVAILAIIVVAHDARAAFVLLPVATVVLVAYRAWTGLSRRYEHLEVLHDFMTVVREGRDGGATTRSVLLESRRVLRAERAELMVVGDAGPDATPAVFGLDADDELVRLPPPAPGGDWWNVTGRERAQILPRRARDAATQGALARLGLRDAMVAPLQGPTGLVAMLLVANRLDDVSTFDRDEGRLLATLASHASVEIQRTNLLEQLRAEAAEKEHQARHDWLTLLPNRRSFSEHVAAAMPGAGSVAVLLMDLDRFKEINDTLGHAAGDRVLIAVAQRLSEATDEGGLLARLGGDEFALLLRDGDAEDVAAAARRMSAALEDPLLIDGLTVDIGVSIGGATSPADGDDAELLLQQADVAMYLAKEAQAGFEMYSAERDVNDVRRLALVGELRQDLAAARLEVHYQPKSDIATGVVVGVEALVRWTNERFGRVGPDEFVPLAECTALIRPLTEMVLRTALDQCARWRQRGWDLNVAVNLSVRSLLDPSLPTMVDEALAAAGVPPEALTLEITESSIMRDPDRNIAVLRRLRAAGVRLAIDDFGTGYSSLSYLKRLPVQEVKIDKSFVSSVTTDADDRSIVQATIRLGHDLGLHVVAEGVEDQAGLDHLRAQGCDVAQGYLISRPQPGAALTAWLAATRVLPLAAAESPGLAASLGASDAADAAEVADLAER